MFMQHIQTDRESVQVSYKLEYWINFHYVTHRAYTEWPKFVRNLEKFCISVHVLHEPYMNSLIPVVF
jgi:N-dimethylarginine dimethylaminohydrolase